MFRQFLAAIYHDWVALVSGVASVAFGVWVALFTPSSAAGRKALWVSFAICLFVGAYRIWRKERKRYEETKAKYETQVLVFEIDQRLNSRTRIVTESDANGTCVRIMLDLQLRFENKDVYPIGMKEITASLHRFGVKGGRPAADIETQFAVLDISSGGITIPGNQFEGMMIQERRITPLYLIRMMLAIEDHEEIKSPSDLDVTDYIRVKMKSGGHQPDVVADLHPNWGSAMNEGGTDLITVTRVDVLERDYRRLDHY